VKEIIKYQTAAGVEPFNEWLKALEETVQAKVDAYVIRVASGLTRNVKSVGSGVFEIKIDFGPGYRVYFGQSGTKIIVLLLGGTKRRQNQDIQQAIDYWKDYRAKNP
jgi:putative addiction module killer protein